MPNMRTATPEDVQAILARPDYRQAASDLESRATPEQAKVVEQVAIARFLAEQGLTLPPGQVTDPQTGQFYEDHSTRNFILGAIALVATAGTASSLLAGAEEAVNTKSQGGPTGVQPGSTSSTLSDIATAGGQAVGAAANTAAGNRYKGASQNIPGAGSYYSTLDRLAQEEDAQRKGALQDIYRQSYFTGGGKGTTPAKGPYDLGSHAVSPDYLASLSALEKQGMSRLATPPRFSTDTMPMPQLSQFQVPPPSTTEQIGNVVSPILTGAGTLANIFNKKPGTQPQTPAVPVPPDTTPIDVNASPSNPSGD
jgi:hypothetical protein